MALRAKVDRTALLVKARRGDGEALGSLLDSYRNYLRIMSRTGFERRLQAKADPSDLVQEVCGQAHQDFSNFRGTTEAELLEWLRRIMATKRAKLIRRYFGTRRRDVRLEQQLEDNLASSSVELVRALSDGALTPRRQAIRDECAVAVADAIARLPEAYREVIILHHVERLPMRDVAERMDRTIDSVQKLWVRATLKLRPLMQEYAS
jgi:RNA polymerase sigma-70 factor (ECF subfamily)